MGSAAPETSVYCPLPIGPVAVLVAREVISPLGCRLCSACAAYTSVGPRGSGGVACCGTVVTSGSASSSAMGDGENCAVSAGSGKGYVSGAVFGVPDPAYAGVNYSVGSYDGYDSTAPGYYECVD